MCIYGVVIQWSYFIIQKGGSALMIACSKGHTAIVQLLLENDANTNLQALVCLLNSINFACKPMSILWTCSWVMAHMSTCKMRYPQKRCKHRCVHIWCCDTVILFHFIMQKGGSALMVACSRGHTAIVQLLLENNANTNLQALVCLLNSICM